MERTTASTKFPIGSKLPVFSLRDCSGKMVSNRELVGSKGLLVVFSCNHCPYVKGSEAMLIELARKYSTEGLTTVAINSNDAAQYPDDSFSKMQEKSRALNLPYPYLHDETQAVAKLFDAACTPECYLFDASATLVYHGAVNDNQKDPGAVKTRHLSMAIEQLLANKPVTPNYVHPFGCSIKWK